MKLGRGIERFDGYSKRYDSALSWDPSLSRFICQNCAFRIKQYLPLGEPPSVLFRLRFKHTRRKRAIIINKTPPTMPPTIPPMGVFFSDWVVELVARESCPVGVLEDTEYTGE